MENEHIERKLWYEDNGRVTVNQADALQRLEPLIILGEAGMGKTALLRWIARSPGYVLCTARSLITHPDPRRFLGSFRVLVIDAIDEVSAHKQGDAVDLVLGRLAELEFPRFILSCRVADWRSATAVEGIRGQYGCNPLEMHLVPFDEDDSINFLSSLVGPAKARDVVTHFNSRNLHGMLGNPQTLELLAKVCNNGPLPESSSALLERSIDVLRVEHNDRKANLQLAKEIALTAAGAASAALILSGSDVISRKAAAHVGPDELSLADVCRLPGAEEVDVMLHTRLFTADGTERFRYWHRRIGEYLGARWLAKVANTPRKRRRVLSMFHVGGLVPASLRGIHAWLALDPAFTPAVIDADPMGLVEYGDPSTLLPAHATRLLNALERVAASNPGLLWNRGDISLGGIAQHAMLDDLRRLITAQDTAFGLRMLVLRALKDAPTAAQLVNELRNLVLDAGMAFACRKAAGQALVPLVPADDWPQVMTRLLGQSDELSVRLAIELMDDIGYQHFSDELIVDLAVSYATKERQTVGVLYVVEHRLPDDRLDGVLDKLAAKASALGEPFKHRDGYELGDFAYHLLSRRIAGAPAQADRLWSWLQPFDESDGYRRDTRAALAKHLQQNQELRRAIQKLVILELPGEATPWERFCRMTDRSSGLAPTPEDVIVLLRTLDQTKDDMRWQDVVQMARHDGEMGAAVRTEAIPFAEHRPDLLQWLMRLAEPPSWKREDDLRTKRHRAKFLARRAKTRAHYQEHIARLRTADYGVLIGPAKAYLGFFHDINEETLPSHERIADWLGADIAAAASSGFEAYLVDGPSTPTADELAASFAQSRWWDSVLIIIVALAERVRRGTGLADVSDDRLLAALFELRRTSLKQDATVDTLEEALETELKARGLWPSAMRRYHEPQLEARLTHVSGLYSLMRGQDVDLAIQLAAEWLTRFPQIAAEVEEELVDRLIRSGRYAELRALLPQRRDLDDERRLRNWLAVGLVVEFDETVTKLAGGHVPPELVWHVRDRSDGERQSVPFQAHQLEWLITTFRALWPVAHPPAGGTWGDTNPWDASDYVISLIKRLGNDTSTAATRALQRLHHAPPDHYLDTIRTVATEQSRLRVETSYSPPTLEAIAAVTRDVAPVTMPDLQEFMLEELDVVQRMVSSDDVESWRGFYDDKHLPHNEEWCRDHLLLLLRQACRDVTLAPEVHVGDDKEVDIGCAVGMLRMPIEFKCQWHRDLWHAADSQLDRLYSQDWLAAGRGIYLVLWFGHQDEPSKRLRPPGRGRVMPTSPQDLQQMLTSASQAALDGRVAVVVLDLSRSPAPRASENGRPGLRKPPRRKAS
jgi:hypothetical protein